VGDTGKYGQTFKTLAYEILQKKTKTSARQFVPPDLYLFYGQATKTS
jgi:hypothetical protein